MDAARSTGHLTGIDFDGFWNDDPRFLDDYTDAFPDDGMLAHVEAELGHRLPDSYVELCRLHNGGMLQRTCLPVAGLADGFMEITSISPIGEAARWSLLGGLGWTTLRDRWGYPDIGIAIATTEAGAHQAVMLDHRRCGPQDEPAVVLVDQEANFAVTPVADDFASFVRALQPPEQCWPAVLTTEDSRSWLRSTVYESSMSTPLREAISAAGLPDAEAGLRSIALRRAYDSPYFHLRKDPDSLLFQDALYRLAGPASDFDAYYPVWQRLIATGDEGYGFRLSGFDRGTVQSWWDTRVQAGDLVPGDDGWRLSHAATGRVEAVLRGQ